jgi:transcriptional regulator GlxA family with amidase domain
LQKSAPFHVNLSFRPGKVKQQIPCHAENARNAGSCSFAFERVAHNAVIDERTLDTGEASAVVKTCGLNAEAMKPMVENGACFARSANVTIGVVIYDGVEPIDIGGTAGVLSMARRILPNLSYRTIAEKAGPVTLAGGLVVMADSGFDANSECDRIIVCGGPGWSNQTKSAAMLDYLKQQPAGGVASVCTGALILAAAGLLGGRTATTRRNAAPGEAAAPLERVAGFAPTAKAVAAAIVVDRGILTSGGVSLAIDGTLAILETMFGASARQEVAELIEYDRAYAANRDTLGHVILG